MEKIRVDDIKLKLVSYDNVESLRESPDIDSDDILEQVNNITLPETAFNTLIKFGKTLMRGIQTIRLIKSQKMKEYKTQFNARVDNNTAYISNITITFDHPGKYVCMFDINGVYTRLVPRKGESSVNSFVVDIDDKKELSKILFQYL